MIKIKILIQSKNDEDASCPVVSNIHPNLILCGKLIRIHLICDKLSLVFTKYTYQPRNCFKYFYGLLSVTV